MLLHEERQAVVTACRSLVASGLVRGTSGNVSVRGADGQVAVSPTGTAYDEMEAEHVAVLREDGTVVDGLLEPTSELGLHLGVYAARPDVGAVVHTHSAFATTYAVLHRSLPPVHYLLAKAGREVRVAPYAVYGGAELARGCVQVLADDHAVLLANHGVVAVGADLVGALSVAEAVETCAEIAWRAETLGTPRLLTASQIDEARSRFGGYGRAQRR